jgi:glycosyltransferase involved in cell wall biosynthesis
MECLSVVIITFNEEKKIGICIDAARKIADEIIVFDSFSTDGTADLAKKKGAIVHQLAFSGYGTQKNAAAAICLYDHVLFLDADELPSEELCVLINQEKKMGFPWDGYSMNRMTNYCGHWIHHGTWYPDKKLRLINRLKGYWNDHLVHEFIEMQDDSRVKHLPGDLLHYAYQSISDHAKKNNRYSDLSAQWMLKKGKKTNLLRIAFNPGWAFVNGYFLRLGILDGLYGFVVAVNIAHLTFLKHVKLFALQRINRKPPPGPG